MQKHCSESSRHFGNYVILGQISESVAMFLDSGSVREKLSSENFCHQPQTFRFKP